MKVCKITLPLSLAIVLISVNAETASAQFVVAEVVKMTVKKVIKAIDLKVQRMQNQTIWLQNAQKALENQLSKLRLTEISAWTDKQRGLYQDYYDELWQIKAVISYYQRIKDLTARQAGLVAQYQRAWRLFSADTHFTNGELDHMQQVYAGILESSIQNLDQVMLTISSFKTQMSDAQRLELIQRAGERLEVNFADLRQFNQQNLDVTLQRSKQLGDINQIKALYEIQ